MKIIVDVMSGDNAPEEIVKGAFLAAAQFGYELVLVGDSDIVKIIAEENKFPIEDYSIELVHTTDVITMEDNPLSVRSKKDSSMARSLSLLSEGYGDAAVSAGNTGALYTGASLLVSRIKGFRKAAIATVLPLEKPLLLLDSGANVIVTDENLEQFALMGSAYMEKVMGIASPRVGLLNNGTERTKGSQLLQDTYARLEEHPSINFVGNVEAKAIPFDCCDVLVTDGFTGNVVLKLTEGLCGFFMRKLKTTYKQNIITKTSALLVKGALKNMKKEFDASEYGGAPLLGISKPVIKAHGSSDAFAFMNAIRQAAEYARSGMIERLSGLNAERRSLNADNTDGE